MAKLIDITGNRYGRLTVRYRVEDSVSKSGRRQPQWFCDCDCGGHAICQAGNLKSGKSTSCGCIWKEKHSKTMVKDLTGQRFGRLTVLERANDVPDGNTMVVAWLCVCDCGNLTTVRACNLKSGNVQSCGCYAKDRSREAHFVDHSYERYNYLTIMPFYESRKTGKHYMTYWMCECDCGNYTFAQISSLKSNNILSCGCIGCSNGEYQIMNILKQKKIPYKRQYYFKDLRTKHGGLMKFDFAILELNNDLKYLIEYQGEQHYQDSDFGRQQREETDPAKRDYCKAHNIPLFETTYEQDIEMELNKILQGNSVPSSQETA